MSNSKNMSSHENAGGAMVPSTLDRRRFLGVAGAGATVAATGGTALGQAAKPDPVITEVQDWNRYLGDSVAAHPYGKPSKFDFARKVGAALAYLALLNYDRVSVIAYADGVAHELPARRGRTQVWPVFRFLEGLAPTGGTDLNAALRGWFGASRTRGLVLLLSDFLDRDGFAPAAQWLAQFRHEVFAVQVHSPDEAEPDLPDHVQIADAETGATHVIETTPALLAAYREALVAHTEDIATICRRHGWAHLGARTDAPFEDLMLKGLREHGMLR